MSHKAVIFSDLHIHNYIQHNEDGKRLDNCLKVLEDLFVFCNSHGIETILFPGDLYDSPKSLPKVVINRTIADLGLLFTRFPNINIYAISGNHDHGTKNLYNSPAVSALTHLSDIFPSNFCLIDNKAFVLDSDNEIILAGVPYYEYAEHFTKKVEEVTEVVGKLAAQYSNPKPFLLTHQTPKGIINKISAYETDPTDPVYDAYEYVFNGHIHNRQELTERYVVVGSPLHRDLGDAGEQKGFLVCNLAKPEKGYVFVPLQGYPEFKEIFEDEEVAPEDAGNFIVAKPRLDNIKLTETARVEDFSTNLTSEKLVQNYWQEVDGKDEKLLQTGLSFLK